MSDSISSIRNLGPATEQAFRRAGVTGAGALRDMGPDEGYRRLLASGERPHFIAYYALVMGLQGRPWNDCRGAEKDALRRRFDALVSEQRGSTDSEVERLLDQIGTGLRRAG